MKASSLKNRILGFHQARKRVGIVLEIIVLVVKVNSMVWCPINVDFVTSPRVTCNHHSTFFFFFSCRFFLFLFIEAVFSSIWWLNLIRRRTWDWKVSKLSKGSQCAGLITYLYPLLKRYAWTIFNPHYLMENWLKLVKILTINFVFFPNYVYIGDHRNPKNGKHNNRGDEKGDERHRD